MHDLTAEGFAIWLMPHSADRETLSAVQHRLGHRLGAPAFVPHVTWLSGAHGTEAAWTRTAETLATTRAPWPWRVTGVTPGQTPFRALALDLAPAPDLATRRDASAAELGLTPPTWSPHASLLYAALSAMAGRQLATHIDAAFAHAGAIVPAHVHMSAVSLWRIDGPVGSWQERARFPLVGTLLG